MKVFISWSGDRSRLVAELLSDWIPDILPSVKPWFSDKDIDRGAPWLSKILEELKDTNIGIVCLTKANLEKPWILFESGAIAKGLEGSAVCTFLIDLKSSDVQHPLAQFNHTSATKADLFKLLCTLNSELGDDAREVHRLEKVFEKFWPEFEERFGEVITETEEGAATVPSRSANDKLDEILTTVRSISGGLENKKRPLAQLGETVDLASAGIDLRIRDLVRKNFEETIAENGRRFCFPSHEIGKEEVEFLESLGFRKDELDKKRNRTTGE